MVPICSPSEFMRLRVSVQLEGFLVIILSVNYLVF